MALVLLLGSMLAPSAAVASSPASTSRAAVSVSIRVLSTRADLVSGGAALVGVFLPSGVDPTRVGVSLGGKNVTGDFGAGRLAG